MEKLETKQQCIPGNFDDPIELDELDEEDTMAIQTSSSSSKPYETMASSPKGTPALMPGEKEETESAVKWIVKGLHNWQENDGNMEVENGAVN